jgi:predicted dehydrogenase
LRGRQARGRGGGDRGRLTVRQHLGRSREGTALIRLGLLSTARINKSLLDAAASLPDLYQVTHIGSRDADKGRAYADAHGIPFACSYDELVEADIEAVYVSAPISMHGEWTRRALRAGRHVLCEKPLGANADDARAMVDAADSAGRTLMEGMHYRYHPQIERLFTTVATELGEVSYVEAGMTHPVPGTSNIRRQRALGGGATMDLGCYPAHWLRQVGLGEPAVEHAEAVAGADGVDVSLSADLRYPGGARGRFVTSMDAETTDRYWLRAVGSAGELVAEQLLSPGAGFTLRLETSDGAVRTESFTGGPTTFTYQLRAFHRFVTDRETPLTDGRDGVATMTLIDALYRAAGLAPREPLDADSTSV